MWAVREERVERGVKYWRLEEVEKRWEWMGMWEKDSETEMHFMGPKAAPRLSQRLLLQES